METRALGRTPISRDSSGCTSWMLGTDPVYPPTRSSKPIAPARYPMWMQGSASNFPRPVFQELGRVPYQEALELQRSMHARVVESRSGDPADGLHVLLLEHDPPVVTVSRRPGARKHLLATTDQLAEHGIELADTDRGGDITYHGPGQLVAYPILDLNLLGLRINSYLRLLEGIVIRTVGAFGLEAERDPDATGVWLDPGGPRARKIAALGVRLSRWCSMHGLALNVDPDLGHFGLIVPCGISDRSVTSMRLELGADCPTMEAVAGELRRQFELGIAGQLESIRGRAPR